MMSSVNCKFSKAQFSNTVSVVRNLGVALKEGFLTQGYSYDYLQDAGQCCSHLKARCGPGGSAFGMAHSHG